MQHYVAGTENVVVVKIPAGQKSLIRISARHNEMTKSFLCLPLTGNYKPDIVADLVRHRLYPWPKSVTAIVINLPQHHEQVLVIADVELLTNSQTLVRHVGG